MPTSGLSTWGRKRALRIAKEAFSTAMRTGQYSGNIAENVWSMDRDEWTITVHYYNRYSNGPFVTVKFRICKNWAV